MEYNAFLRKQQLLWGMTARRGKTMTETSGWFSSVNLKPFSDREMSEFAENVATKLHTPYLQSGLASILEIGGGSGLVLRHLLPKSKRYEVTDISDEVIERCRGFLTDIPEVPVFHKLFAHEVDVLPGLFDVIVINSVMQYFPDLAYAKDVLRKCRDKLSPGGVVFCGDIMAADRMQELRRYISDNGGDPERQNFDRLLLFTEGELASIASAIGFSSSRASDKIHTIPNELALFRFDILLYK